MRIPRIYTPLALTPGARVTLEGDAASHLARVLRLKPGAALVLFNGNGIEYSATVTLIGKHQVETEIVSASERSVESPLALTLIQAVSRGERMDFTLQKAVELGVQRIAPVLSARTVVQLDDGRRERRHEHWMKVIAGACEQSGRSYVPRLEPLQPLATALDSLTGGLRLILDPQGTAAFATLTPDSAVTLLVGPEGGFDDSELRLAHQKDFIGLRLGPRVLRTETAGLVALAALQTLWGDIGA